MYANFFRSLPLLIAVIALFFTGCSIMQPFYKQETEAYPGKVFLTNGEVCQGIVTIPWYEAELVKIAGDDGMEKEVISKYVDQIEFFPREQPERKYVVRYLPVKKNKKKRYWLMRIAEGPYVTAYIAGLTYSIKPDGNIELSGIRQRIDHGPSRGSTVINPSFPIYFDKKGEDKLVYVGVQGGVNFEAASFRAGVSHSLADDPKLCEYIRREKLGVDDLPFMVENYMPDRGDESLVADGKEVEARKRKTITNDLDRELFWYSELAIPSNDHYGTQWGVGIRSSFYRFFTYGFDLGAGSADYITQEKRLENHGGNGFMTATVIDDDFSRGGLFRANAYVGPQLPLNFGRVYLVPAAHFSLGALLNEEYPAASYGPMTTLDFGIKRRRGGIVMLCTGYRYNTSLVSEDTKEELSYPGFEAHQSYGAFLIRLSYKF